MLIETGDDLRAARLRKCWRLKDVALALETDLHYVSALERRKEGKISSEMARRASHVFSEPIEGALYYEPEVEDV